MQLWFLSTLFVVLFLEVIAGTYITVRFFFHRLGAEKFAIAVMALIVLVLAVVAMHSKIIEAQKLPPSTQSELR